MERQYCVYKHTAPNGKVYIGITSQIPEDRWGKNGNRYVGAPHFYPAIKKYGWDNIKHEILETGLSRLEAGNAEKKYIQLYNSTDRRFGYNMTFGGDYGSKMTPDVRKKISEANKRYYAEHPEAREVLKKNSTGHNHSDFTKKKMSDSHVWTKQSDEWVRHRIESLRRGYSDPVKRKAYEDYFRRLAEMGKKKSIPVEQIDDTGMVVCVYSSMKEAERMTGISSGNISKCCRDRFKRAGGYYWRISQIEISSAEKSIN